MGPNYSSIFRCKAPLNHRNSFGQVQKVPGQIGESMGKTEAEGKESSDQGQNGEKKDWRGCICLQIDPR